MNSKDYWEKRGQITQDHLMQKADDFIEDMEKSYKEAAESIEKDIAIFFQRFADNEGLTLAEANKLLKSGELEQFKMTVEEYIEKGMENSVSGKWIKELESASDLYRISRLKALNIQIQQQIEMLAAYKEQGLNKTLKEIFEEGYYRNIFDIQQFEGIGSAFTILDTRRINAALSKPWTYDGETFSQRIWKDKEKLKYGLDKILTQGIIKGESPEKTAAKIAKELGVEMNNARRLVLTESAAISTRASLESYSELNVEEIEILVTLDEKTCEICGPMDGRHFPKSEGKIGLNLSPFHPRCRCTFVPYFDDEFTADEQRAARGKDGKTYYVPGNMTYEEWFDKYVKSDKEYSLVKKKYDNRFSDKKQHEDYINVLGKKQVGSFADFQNLKYNDIEGWNKLKVAYKDQPIRARIQSDLQPKTIEPGKQGKHILEHNNYIEGRSYLTISIEEAQELVNKYAGTGELKRTASGQWNNKEVIKVNQDIGVCMDKETGIGESTKCFTIHYSKNGTHIVPSKDRE